jgi:hypothetical protein
VDESTVKALPSKKVNQGVASKEERGAELYPTPPVLTKALLTQTGEAIPAQVWEPMAGLGHMTEPLRDTGRQVLATDHIDYGWDGLDSVIDFFSLPIPGEAKTWPDATPYDCIITNPAFSESDRFVRRALKFANKVVILNRLAFLEGKGRSDILTKHLTRFYPVIERPPMMHRWMRGLWEPDEKGQPRLIEDDGIWREWVGKKAPSAMPVAWFIFERHKPKELGDGFVGKRISWRAAA